MTNDSSGDCQQSCVSRRGFLATSGTVSTLLLAEIFPGSVVGQHSDATAELSKMERKKIGQLSALKDGETVSFNYPNDGELSNCMLVKTGEKSGGGLGEGQDVVAFSGRCTHMGGSLDGEYKPEHKVAGPCSLHLTTFDLTRHGMVVAGHATQALPQILLELAGDDIYATGVVGLLYGNSMNA